MTERDETAGVARPIPHVRVAGGPGERGAQYGTVAHERVQRSLEAYEQVFAHYTGWTWAQVRGRAAVTVPAIQRAHAASLEEMQGIARGAGADFEDVLALNLRTEVMFSARARAAAGDGAPPPECSSFCVLPDASATGHLLVGQNWDWLPHCYDTVVVVEARRDDGPNFVTVVEAGLLAKVGMNAAGVGVTTNSLVTDLDLGEPALPYHVVLRALLDADGMTEALATVQRGLRASSANYLLAHRDGIGIDVEAAPGGFGRLSYLAPTDGVLVHTNHFLAVPPGVTDVSPWAMPDSLARHQRLSRALATAPRPLTLERVQDALRDHADHPNGVCCHPDLRDHPADQGATIASVVMDLEDRVMWLAEGNPCTAPYRRIDYGELLAG
jgi:isopenicillin-N N-acyltransferase like protein